MKNGVPWTVVFGKTPHEILKYGLPPEYVAAFGIVFGEMEGSTFDWNRMEWEKRT